MVILFGLWFNLKTVELNQKIHRLRRELETLKKENAYLEELVLSRTQLSQVEVHIKDMNLKMPDKIHYIELEEPKKVPKKSKSLLRIPLKKPKME